jgi:muconolactone delta-isomerase
VLACHQALGLYRAASQAQLDGLLGALPLSDWMHVTVTPLAPLPNDPASARPSRLLGCQPGIPTGATGRAKRDL